MMAAWIERETRCAITKTMIESHLPGSSAA